MKPLLMFTNHAHLVELVHNAVPQGRLRVVDRHLIAGSQLAEQLEGRVRTQLGRN